MIRSPAICAVLFPILLAACSPTPGGGGDGSGGNDNTAVAGEVTGELLYFSGRPAPQWDLVDTEQTEIARRLEGISAVTSPGDFPRFGPVAYHILNPEGAAGMPDEVIAQDGTILVRSGEVYSYYSDDKDLEGFLRASAMADGVYAELGIIEVPQKSSK